MIEEPIISLKETLSKYKLSVFPTIMVSTYKKDKDKNILTDSAGNPVINHTGTVLPAGEALRTLGDPNKDKAARCGWQWTQEDWRVKSDSENWKPSFFMSDDFDIKKIEDENERKKVWEALEEIQKRTPYYLRNIVYSFKSNSGAPKNVFFTGSDNADEIYRSHIVHYFKVVCHIKNKTGIDLTDDKYLKRGVFDPSEFSDFQFCACPTTPGKFNNEFFYDPSDIWDFWDYNYDSIKKFCDKVNIPLERNGITSYKKEKISLKEMGTMRVHGRAKGKINLHTGFEPPILTPLYKKYGGWQTRSFIKSTYSILFGNELAADIIWDQHDSYAAKDIIKNTMSPIGAIHPRVYMYCLTTAMNYFIKNAQTFTLDKDKPFLSDIENKDVLIDIIKNNNVLLQAPTGAGKTTLFSKELNYLEPLVLVNRRVLADTKWNNAMTVDEALKRNIISDDIDIAPYNIVIEDESQLKWTDIYRCKQNTAMNAFLKKCNRKLLMSATPTPFDISTNTRFIMVKKAEMKKVQAFIHKVKSNDDLIEKLYTLCDRILGEGFMETGNRIVIPLNLGNTQIVKKFKDMVSRNDKSWNILDVNNFSMESNEGVKEIATAKFPNYDKYHIVFITSKINTGTDMHFIGSNGELRNIFYVSLEQDLDAFTWAQSHGRVRETNSVTYHIFKNIKNNKNKRIKPEALLMYIYEKQKPEYALKYPGFETIFNNFLKLETDFSGKKLFDMQMTFFRELVLQTYMSTLNWYIYIMKEFNQIEIEIIDTDKFIKDIDKDPSVWMDSKKFITKEDLMNIANQEGPLEIIVGNVINRNSGRISYYNMTQSSTVDIDISEGFKNTVLKINEIANVQKSTKIIAKKIQDIRHACRKLKRIASFLGDGAISWVDLTDSKYFSNKRTYFWDTMVLKSDMIDFIIDKVGIENFDDANVHDITADLYNTLNDKTMRRLLLSTYNEQEIKDKIKDAEKLFKNVQTFLIDIYTELTCMRNKKNEKLLDDFVKDTVLNIKTFIDVRCEAGNNTVVNSINDIPVGKRNRIELIATGRTVYKGKSYTATTNNNEIISSCIKQYENEMKAREQKKEQKKEQFQKEAEEIVMLYGKGFSLRDIADRFGKSKNWVKIRLDSVQKH